MEAKSLHVIICVYTDAVEHALKTARFLQALGVEVIFFRNKCEDLGEAYNLVKDHDSKKLEEVTGQPQRLVLGSAKTPMGIVNNMGIEELKAMLKETDAVVERPRKRPHGSLDATPTSQQGYQ